MDRHSSNPPPPRGTFSEPPPASTATYSPVGLWRVAGVSRSRLKFMHHVGLVIAPDREKALRLAIERYSPLYTDISVPDDEPLASV